MLHPTFGTNFLSSFISLIFQMSHLLPHLISFHICHLHLFHYPLLHHSFIQNSKLTCFINLYLFRLSLFLYTPDWFHGFIDLALIGFYLLFSFAFVNFLFWSHTCGRLSWLLVSFWAYLQLQLTVEILTNWSLSTACVMFRISGVDHEVSFRRRPVKFSDV